MRRSLLGSLLALLAACVSAAPVADRVHVVVLHTNDVHGQVQPRRAVWLDREAPPLIGGLPRVAAYVREVRDEVRAEGPGAGLLVVDAGDWFQGTPEGTIEGGRAFVRAMAAVGFDAQCVGNHEFDHGIEPLVEMLRSTGVHAVLANVRTAKGGPRPAWATPWRIVEVAGIRVGLVGLLTPDTPSITHRDARSLVFQDPPDALDEVRDELAGRVDWLLPLTHLGVRGDRRLARRHPDLPLIVGGHSHTYLPEGVLEGTVRIVQVGSKASAVGRADYWFDAATLRIVRSEYRVVDLLEDPPAEERNPRVEELCTAMVKASEARMAEVVGTLVAPLSRSRHRVETSPAGNLITDVLRERSGADVALQNRGGIRCDLEAGPVTRRDLFELLPFGNHLVVLRVSGAVLRKALEASVEDPDHSGLEFSGMKVRVREDPARPTGYALVDAFVGGEPLQPDAEYTVATNSFLADGGDTYLELPEGGVRRDDPVLLRDLLEHYLRERGPLRPPTENRYLR